MLMPGKLPSRLRLIRPLSLPPPLPRSRRHCRRCLSTSRPAPWPQNIPLGEYYESILRRAADRPAQRRPGPADAPLVVDVPLSDPRAADEKTRTPLDATTSFDTSPPAPPPTAAEAMTPQERVRNVFGSRVLGAAEREDRAAAKRAQGTLVAGVLVPPRPEEPDNCCMSGCVNCVWDRYGEDLEEWTARKTEAEHTLRALGGGARKEQEEEEAEEKQTTREMLEEEAYSDVPMSIREFIKLEKRLRDKHKHEGTVSGWGVALGDTARWTG